MERTMSQSNILQYVGLDVSLKETSICVVDESGKVVWRGRTDSTPQAIAEAIKKHARHVVRIGLESGQLSTWLFHGLNERSLPVICIDARHAKAALSLTRGAFANAAAHPRQRTATGPMPVAIWRSRRWPWRTRRRRPSLATSSACCS